MMQLIIKAPSMTLMFFRTMQERPTHSSSSSFQFTLRQPLHVTKIGLWSSDHLSFCSGSKMSRFRYKNKSSQFICQCFCLWNFASSQFKHNKPSKFARMNCCHQWNCQLRERFLLVQSWHRQMHPTKAGSGHSQGKYCFVCNSIYSFSSSISLLHWLHSVYSGKAQITPLFSANRKQLLSVGDYNCALQGRNPPSSKQTTHLLWKHSF